ncbi:MAG: hypothetical protein M3546_06525 [Actinomycetota bacterium]|nr:hypothetical protein [Actinomycetota bacterium]
MSEKREQESEPLPEIFDDLWEFDSDSDDEDQPQAELQSDENDVEAHGGSGFSRPE